MGQSKIEGDKLDLIAGIEWGRFMGRNEGNAKIFLNPAPKKEKIANIELNSQPRYFMAFTALQGS